jgi:hypothetical protein
MEILSKAFRSAKKFSTKWAAHVAQRCRLSVRCWSRHTERTYVSDSMAPVLLAFEAQLRTAHTRTHVHTHVHTHTHTHTHFALSCRTLAIMHPVSIYSLLNLVAGAGGGRGRLLFTNKYGHTVLWHTEHVVRVGKHIAGTGPPPPKSTKQYNSGFFQLNLVSVRIMSSSCPFSLLFNDDLPSA